MEARVMQSEAGKEATERSDSRRRGLSSRHSSRNTAAGLASPTQSATRATQSDKPPSTTVQQSTSSHDLGEEAWAGYGLDWEKSNQVMEIIRGRKDVKRRLHYKERPYGFLDWHYAEGYSKTDSSPSEADITEHLKRCHNLERIIGYMYNNTSYNPPTSAKGAELEAWTELLSPYRTYIDQATRSGKLTEASEILRSNLKHGSARREELEIQAYDLMKKYSTTGDSSAG